MAATYIVLRQEHAMLDREEGVYDDTLVYTLLGTAEGDTGRQAIKAFSEPEGEEPVPGIYVASAARYWTEEECSVSREVRYTPRSLVPGGGRVELQHIPGQTTIEEETEVIELAAIIEGARDDDAPKDDETPEELEERQEEAAKVGVSDDNPVVDPNEFGPETEEPFDPTKLGGREEA